MYFKIILIVLVFFFIGILKKKVDVIIFIYLEGI